ncbi:hypothetical protein BDC45DRAFT_474726 [Circinella umbellata]|nr:hypothetical protein BDC45DRAFT_474726 [Circinella umbellata]
MYLGWRRRGIISWPSIATTTVFLLLLLLLQQIGPVFSEPLLQQQSKLPLSAIPFCVQHHSTSSKNKNTIQPCFEESQQQRQRRHSSTYNKREKKQNVNNSDNGSTNAMIIIDFTCESTNQDECNKVKASLTKASEYISSVLVFKTPLYVNATYLSFCQQLGQCEEASEGTIGTGQAYPSVSYLMQEGNTTRMYPQALLKQYHNLAKSVDWYEYDMNAYFNSEITWYYEDDGNPIKENETDLLLTIIHEFVHGLGFVSAWSDDTYERFSMYDSTMKKFLTPMPLNPPNELPEVSAVIDSEEGVQPYWGFVDFPLDKLLYGNKYPLTLTTQVLNEWGNSNVMFANILDMVNDWLNGKNFREQAEAVYQMATERGGIKIMIDNVEIMVLETSLSPFQDGSSLTHVDQSTYATTDDYLMCYSAMRGISLNNLSKFHPLGPLGPSLVRVLAKLGYFIQPSYNQHVNIKTVQPNISFWVPPVDLVGTVTNPSPAVSINANGPAHIPSASDTPSSSASSFISLLLLSSPLSSFTVSLFICTKLSPRLLFFYIFITLPFFYSCYY